MKRITLLLLCFYISVNAQPVLTSADFIDFYEANIFTVNTNGLTNGTAGENQVWDYSFLTLEPSTESLQFVPPFAAPFAENFLDSNYCLKFTEDSFSSYNFQKISNTTFEFLGSSDTNDFNYFNDSQVIFEFPYTYGMAITDTYFSEQFNDPIRTITTFYDAYGTLITPYGTFNNVIRQKVIREDDNEEEYYWYGTNPFQFILVGNFDNNGQVRFYKSNNLSIDQKKKDKTFSIYPNPTKGDFLIKNNNNYTKDIFVTVYDVTANAIIQNQTIDNDLKVVNFKNFPSGLYFVKITDKNNQLLYSEKIIKN